MPVEEKIYRDFKRKLLEGKASDALSVLGAHGVDIASRAEYLEKIGTDDEISDIYRSQLNVALALEAKAATGSHAGSSTSPTGPAAASFPPASSGSGAASTAPAAAAPLSTSSVATGPTPGATTYGGGPAPAGYPGSTTVPPETKRTGPAGASSSSAAAAAAATAPVVDTPGMLEIKNTAISRDIKVANLAKKARTPASIAMDFKGILNNDPENAEAKEVFKVFCENKKNRNKAALILCSSDLSLAQRQTLFNHLDSATQKNIVAHACNTSPENMTRFFNGMDNKTQAIMLEKIGKRGWFWNTPLWKTKEGKAMFKDMPEIGRPGQPDYKSAAHRQAEALAALEDPKARKELFKVLSPGQQAELIAAKIPKFPDSVPDPDTNLEYKKAVDDYQKAVDDSKKLFEGVNAKTQVKILMSEKLPEAQRGALFSALDPNAQRKVIDKMGSIFSEKGQRAKFINKLPAQDLAKLIATTAEKTKDFSADPDLASKMFYEINNPEKRAQVLGKLLAGDEKSKTLAANLYRNENLTYEDQRDIMASESITNEAAAEIFKRIPANESDERYRYPFMETAWNFSKGSGEGFVAGCSMMCLAGQMLWRGKWYEKLVSPIVFVGGVILAAASVVGMTASVVLGVCSEIIRGTINLISKGIDSIAKKLGYSVLGSNGEKKLNMLLDPALKDEKKAAMFQAITPEEQAGYLVHKKMSIDTAKNYFTGALAAQTTPDAKAEYATKVLEKMCSFTDWSGKPRARALFNSITDIPLKAEILSNLSPKAATKIFNGIPTAKAQAEILSKVKPERQVHLFQTLKGSKQQAAVLRNLLDTNRDLAIKLFQEGLKDNPQQRAKILSRLNPTQGFELFKTLSAADQAAVLNTGKLSDTQKVGLFKQLEPDAQIALLTAKDSKNKYICGNSAAIKLFAKAEEATKIFILSASDDLRAIKLFKHGVKDSTGKIDPKAQARILESSHLDPAKDATLFNGLQNSHQQVNVLNAIGSEDKKFALLAQMDSAQLARVFSEGKTFGFGERTLSNADALFKELINTEPDGAKKALAVLLKEPRNCKDLLKGLDDAQLLKLLQQPGGEKLLSKIEDSKVINKFLFEGTLSEKDQEKYFKALPTSMQFKIQQMHDHDSDHPVFKYGQKSNSSASLRKAAAAPPEIKRGAGAGPDSDAAAAPASPTALSRGS